MKCINKYLIASFFIFGLCFSVFCQTPVTITNKGIDITISGTKIYNCGKITTQDTTISGINYTGIFNNDGDIHIIGDIRNNSKSHFYSTPVVTLSNGRTIFDGVGTQKIIGDTSINFYKIILSKSGSTDTVLLSQSINVSDTLKMGVGSVFLNGKNIDLKTSGFLANESNTTRVFGSSGFIKTQKIISSPNINTNYGGLGLMLHNPGITLGASTIQRGHAAQTGSADGSILRYYNLTPSLSVNIKAQVRMRYFRPNEIGTTSGTYVLWSSTNSGLNWINRGRVDSSQYVVADTVPISNMRITAANPICLNPPNVVISPSTVVKCLGDSATLNAGSFSGSAYNWSGVISATTQTIKIFTTGRYIIRVTDINGCVGKDTVDAIFSPSPTARFVVTPKCEGAAAIFNAATSIGTSLTYNWDFGDAGTGSGVNTTHIYASQFIYNVKLTVTAPGGCADDTTIRVPAYAIPSPNFSFLNACQAKLVSFINLTTVDTVSTLSSSYTLAWNFGDGTSSSATNPTKTYSFANVYPVRLIATTSFGCKDTIYKNIVINPIPNPGFTYPANLCQGYSASFVSSSTISTGSISTYQWQFGDGTSTTGLSPLPHNYPISGSYTIKLVTTSDSLCVDSITHSLTVNPKPTVAFTANNACVGSVVTFNNSSSSGATYLWNFGDGSSSTNQSPSHTYAVESTYTVKLIVTSAFGCSDSILLPVTIYPKPSAAFTSGNSCLYQSIPFVNTSSISNSTTLSYAWTMGDGTTQTTTNVTHTYPGVLSYAVRLIATSINGCKDTATATATVYALPTANFSFSNLNHCQESSVSFTNTSSGAINYTWNFGNGNSLSSVNPSQTFLSSGIFSVKLVASTLFGCKDSITKPLTIFPKPVASFSPSSLAACLGSSILFTNNSTIVFGGSIVSNTWNFGNATTSLALSPSQTYASVGTYSVSLIVNSNKGCKDTANVFVSVSVRPTVLFTANQTCGTDSTVIVNSTIAPGGTQYFWNFGDGTTSTLQNPTKSYSIAGVYTIKLRATDNLGCSDSTNHTITYPITPTTQFSFANPCLGQSTTFTNTSAIGFGSLTYNWNFGDGSTSNNQSPLHTYSIAAVYNVRLISTSQSGCNDTLIQVVNVGPTPTASFYSFSSVCSESSISFTNTTLASNGVPSYLWNFGDGTNSILENPSKSYTNAGVYTVVLTASYGVSCTTTYSKIITVKEKPVANFSSNSACLGDQTNFTNLSSISSGSLSSVWNFGNFTSSNQVSPSTTYLLNGSYAVRLISLASNGCTDTLIQTAVVLAVPTVSLGGNISTCGSQYVFDAQNAGASYLWGNNSTNQTFVATSNGFYKVTVTLANGCDAKDSSVLTLNTIAVVNLGNDTTVCGNLLLDAAYTGSTYLWNTGSTSQTITANLSGEYSVIMTDQNTCVAVDTINIISNILPTVNLGTDLDVCTGSAILLDAQNTGLNFLWNDNSTSQTLVPSISGLYWVKVTDVIGCFNTDSVFINYKALPTKPFGSDTVACATVSLNALNIGSNYLWSDNTTAQTLQASSNGLYSVTITGANTCISQDTISVTLNTVIVNLGSTQTACENAGVLLDAGNAGSTYLWSNNQTTQSIVPTTSGLFSVVVTNGFGCSATGSVNVNLNLAPIKPFGNDTMVCSGIILTALNLGSTYQWSGQVVATSQTINATANGNYFLEITGSNNCVTKDTINLTVNSAIVVSLGSNLIICQGLNVTLDAGAAVSYLWNTGATSQTISPTLSSNYSVVVTDAFGCLATDTLNVNFLPAPIVNLGNDTASCGNFLLNAQNIGLNYNWNNGLTTQLVNVVNSGLYFVDVTSANSCVTRDSVQVTINQNPNINLGSNLLGCNGDVITLNSGISGGSYLWNTGATSQSINIVASGFYQVNVVDANNCSGIGNVVVAFNNKPLYSLGADTSVCGSFQLNAGNPGSTYLWNGGATSQTLNVSNSGTYAVTITNQYLCSIIDTINLVVNPNLSINLGNDTSVCQGNSVLLNAGNAGVIYAWNTGASTPTINAIVSGNYFVTVTNSQNCKDIDTINVTVVNKPIVNLGIDKTICRGSTITLNAGNLGSNFSWGSSTGLITQTSQIITLQDTGVYWVAVSNGVGCSASDTLQIRLDADYVEAKYLCASSAFAGDTLVFINLSYPNPQTNWWNFSDGTFSTTANPNHKFYFANQFPVSLAAKINNCSDTLTKILNIQPRLSSPVDSIIPYLQPSIISANLFPNPNTGNFSLQVSLNVSAYLSIQIFDLYGQLLMYRSIYTNVYLDTFDMNNFANGIYIVKLNTVRDQRAIRLVKTN